MNSDPSLAAVKRRIAGHLVGRDYELELVLAAVDAGRDIVLEGPPGTSKTTMLKAITAEWSIPLLFVEGNADLTPAKLVGHHNPARVLRRPVEERSRSTRSCRGGPGTSTSPAADGRWTASRSS